DEAGHPRQQETSIGIEVRAHLAGPARPDDEYGRRAGDQPHEDAGARGGTREADRHAELFKGTPAEQGQRVSGEVRVQPAADTATGDAVGGFPNAEDTDERG